jgi:hypothetical protein
MKPSCQFSSMPAQRRHGPGGSTGDVRQLRHRSGPRGRWQRAVFRTCSLIMVADGQRSDPVPPSRGSPHTCGQASTRDGRRRSRIGPSLRPCMSLPRATAGYRRPGRPGTRGPEPQTRARRKVDIRTRHTQAAAWPAK